MNPFRSATTALSAVALAALVATSPTAAQPVNQMQMRAEMGMICNRMTTAGGFGDYVEGHIAFLKAELKITDAQMPQWTALADALRLNATRMSEMQNTMMQGGMYPGNWTLSAPDRLYRMEKMMTAMIKMMTALMESEKTTKSALTPLYDVLTDEQKKVADQLVQRSYVSGLW